MVAKQGSFININNQSCFDPMLVVHFRKDDYKNPAGKVRILVEFLEGPYENFWYDDEEDRDADYMKLLYLMSNQKTILGIISDKKGE